MARKDVALQVSETRFHQLAELAPTGIFMIKQDKIVYCNPAGLRLLGGTMLAQVIGRRDNGCGFTPVRLPSAGSNQGWGLLIMQERAEAVGGHCRIESQLGQGAQVIVEIKLPVQL